MTRIMSVALAAIIVIFFADLCPAAHQETIEHRLHPRHLGSDMLAQARVVAKILRLHTTDDPLGIGH